MQALSNQRHECFAQRVASGAPGADAYAELYPDISPAALYAASSRLLRKPEIRERVSQLQAKSESAAVLSLSEKRTFLRCVVQTPIGAVDENSVLAQTLKRGETGDVREIRMPDKLRALELDARLAGELDGPDGGGGVINIALIGLNLPSSVRTITEQ